MMSCEEVRNRIEEFLAGTLDEALRRELSAHLQVCPECRAAVEEARLAGIVLGKAAARPAPPEALASNIKSAIRTRLVHRPRPLHERALGSPAFMATCASLLCGAIICLIAIWRVSAVPTDVAPAAVAQAAPVVVQSLVTVKPRPAVATVAVASLPSLREQPPSRHVTLAAYHRPARSVAPASPWRQPRRLPRVAQAPPRPREARAPRTLMTVQPAAHEVTEEFVPVSFLTPSVQRISLPGSMDRSPGGLAESLRAPAARVENLPPAETRPVGLDTP